MTQRVLFKQTVITHYECNDCGMVARKSRTLRPNGKFCDAECMDYVLSKREIKHQFYKQHIKCIVRNKSYYKKDFVYCPYCGEEL